MRIQTVYWFTVIKICRLLIALGCSDTADKLATLTGLKARLAAFVDGHDQSS